MNINTGIKPAYTRSQVNFQLVGAVNNGGYRLSCNSSGQVDYDYYKVNQVPSTPLWFDIAPALNDYVPTSSAFVPRTIAQVTAGTNTMQQDVYSLNQRALVRDGLQTANSIGSSDYFIALKGYSDNNPLLFDSFEISGSVYDYQFINDFYTTTYLPTYQCGNIYMYTDVNYWRAVYTNIVSGAQIIIPLTSSELLQVPYVHDTYVNDGNEVQIQFSLNERDWVVVKECRFEPKVECKYTPVICDFISKYGVWKRIFFYKASYVSLEMTNQEYQLDVFGNTSQKRAFMTNGNVSIKVNTDWVDEYFNNDLAELMMSENIMLDGLSVRMKTKSTELQKNINNSLINYTLEFDYNQQLIRR